MFGKYNKDDYEKFFYSKFKKPIPSFVNDFLYDEVLPKKFTYSITNLHLAILVRRGNIIALAYNKVGSRSSGASTRGAQGFVHAEKNLLLSLKKNYSLLNGSDIYVVRFARNQGCYEFKYSQPCPECTVLLEKCIKQYNLNRVYFS